MIRKAAASHTSINHCRSRKSLPYIIGNDLLKYEKLPLFLFFCVIVTALLVIVTVHHTRSLTEQHEKLILEHDTLDIEWRNLILEKNTLNNHSRIELIATKKLNMQHIDPIKENIVLQN